MDPEGTSRDDLDVRLHWPGTDPEGARETEEAPPSNGRTRGGPDSSSDSDTLGVDSRAYSERLLRFEHAITARLQKVERQIEQLLDAVSDIRARLPLEAGDDRAVPKRLEELSRQLEVLRRRMPLRAGRELEVTPEVVDRIAESVADRLAQADLGVEPRRSSRRRSQRS